MTIAVFDPHPYTIRDRFHIFAPEESLSNGSQPISTQTDQVHIMSIDTSTDAANEDAVFDSERKGCASNRCRVLLVFNQAHIVRVLKTQLEQHDFQISTAYNAESALKMIHTGVYDAVVIDVVISGMGGVQLCMNINRQLQHDKPQLFLTGVSASAIAALHTDWPINAQGLDWPISVTQLLEATSAFATSTLAIGEVGNQR